MRLRTLGGFELTEPGPDGQPVRVMGAQKPLALIAYLALTRYHRASRDLIQYLLWSDVGPERGRKTLRQTIWSIRHRLGESSLRSEGDDLVLDLPLEVDCQAFEAAVEAGNLEAAWEAYAGHFIPGFATPGGAGFEQWADLQRDHYRALWLTVGEELTRRRLAENHPRDAVLIATRLRDELPDRPDLWRILLQTLLSSGQRMQALVEAELLESRLRADGEKPDRETAALLGRIRSLPAEESVEPERPRADLVGREQVFASLLGAWQAAAAGAGRAVVLRGSAGIGKTRMLRDCHDRLVATGTRSLLLRARPADRDLPYGLVASLADALAHLPGAMGISPGAAAALVELSPSLSSLFSRTEPLSRHQDELLRLRTLALAELLHAVAEESPLAVFVDDLHWADEHSRQVIGSLAARITDQPVLFLLTLRPLRGGWPLPPGADLIELQPLTLPQIEDLVASMAAAEAPLLNELGRQVYAVSAGVPLLALSAIELALERRLIRIDEDRWVCPNPDRLRMELSHGSVLEQLLQELPTGGLEVLLALAVVGRPVGDGVLAAISDHPGGEALLLSLEQRGLVIRLGESFDIAHDKLAEAALAIADTELRARVSRRVARALLEAVEPSIRTLRLAGRLLVMSDDPEGAACFRSWLRLSGRREYWRDLVTAAADFLGQDATVEQARQLARTIPASMRLVRGYPQVAAALGLVLLVAASTAAVRAVDRWTEPPARTMVISDLISSDGFLWDTSVASHRDGEATRNAAPITVIFQGSDGHVTRNTPAQAEVRLVTSRPLALEGTLVRRVERGRARFDDLVIRGLGPFQIEVRAGSLRPVRTRVLRSSGGFGHLEDHQLVITGGELNGQPIDSARRTVRVAPGAELAGTLRLRVLTTSSNAAVLMGAVALWGDRRRNFIVLTALPSHGAVEMVMPLEDKIRGTRFTAPSAPGRYRLVLVTGTETEMRYIASRTNWTVGEPIWFDGDDIADLPGDALDSLDRYGHVSWTQRQFMRELGPDPHSVAKTLVGTTLEVVVER
ncbi:MAG TPA: AAA family ATPase [Gemmatimonadales bacterium]|nr:AAA family ATPase [Gemmatimonadales bacterium]